MAIISLEDNKLNSQNETGDVFDDDTVENGSYSSDFHNFSFI